MKISLHGRVALVTGGSRGIGRAIALALAEAGADVAVNYKRDEAAARETVAAIERLGRRARAYRAGVENFDEATAMIAAIERDFGSLGVLINNAGIGSLGNAAADTDFEEIERLMRVHAYAPFNLSKLALPLLRRQPRSDIVMISSIATLYMRDRGVAYNMAKAAMEALALTMAKEERAHGVRTNVVSPSLTATEMGSRLAIAVTGVSEIHQLNEQRPYGRVSEPEDVAAVVTYLVSDANAYVNGQIIAVDGGGPMTMLP
ncbi:MAG: short-chain dehydrogenase/reductase [Hydrocarboniphaga sp.]|uniref:SDR family NAD(P)-dependent oxidoreductase n=1 Tax=Hydrocarboniphaga sp. TaxID=2033016 RepID=UPI0026359B48|nr:SDR family oxidoreductase [Hydrocarboniphaga sp.]MDB5969969.1 short-chain dehydrogenase/reductase [Hydrocarboniphaga sp.]